ncbi:hypothetical protein BSKO_09645 [Bryopsis sp. KO-2023]|nr:hypothetical protein BSKO_09645 [Bryopsis sp. KO-2023]
MTPSGYTLLLSSSGALAPLAKIPSIQRMPSRPPDMSTPKRNFRSNTQQSFFFSFHVFPGPALNLSQHQNDLLSTSAFHIYIFFKTIFSLVPFFLPVFF